LTAFANQLLDGVALFGLKAAQLAFDIDAGLAAHVHQVLAFDVQFTSQYVNSNLLALQTRLPTCA
jgi:hypothetical protein